MNFRLKFRTSATTSLEPYEILARIQFELKDKKYKGVYVTDKSISFKDNPWRMRWNFEPTMLDEGEFEIGDRLNGGRPVTLKYYYNFSGFLLFIAMITVISIFQNDYYNILFVGIVFCVIIPIDVTVHKSKASELIAAVS